MLRQFSSVGQHRGLNKAYQLVQHSRNFSGAMGLMCIIGTKVNFTCNEQNILDDAHLNRRKELKMEPEHSRVSEIQLFGMG